MEIRFIGPLDRVTGRCYELKDTELDVHFLVDCGMVQGERDAAQANGAPFPFDPASLDFVLLTHAHLDHCGLIPRLYAEGFDGPIYCTEETKRLARIVLQDAQGHGAPYRKDDIARIRWREPRRAIFGNFCPVGHDVFVQFHRAGHIPGAVSFTVTWGPPPRSSRSGTQRSIHFSGDLGPNPEGAEAQPLMGHRMQLPQADYAVMESTYGATVRPEEDRDPEHRLSALSAVLREALENNGVVIIPAFATARTQDLLFDLHVLMSRRSELSRFRLLLDAPMATRVNHVYAEALTKTYVSGKHRNVRRAWLGRGAFRLLDLDANDPRHEKALFDALRELFDPKHHPTDTRPTGLQRWRRHWEPLRDDTVEGPAVILAGNGMCAGGPVLRHLAKWLPDPRTTVLFTGYCASDTPGGQLLGLAGLPQVERARLGGSLHLDGRRISPGEVRATIRRVGGYSGHADQRGLVSWALEGHRETSEPVGRTIFLSHGDQSPRRELAAKLRTEATKRCYSVEVELPDDPERWFDLERKGPKSTPPSSSRLVNSRQPRHAPGGTARRPAFRWRKTIER